MRAAAPLGILALVLVRAWFAARWGLLADEAYYWTWSRHLAAGYLDQPPLVAWMVAGGTALLGATALGVRLLFLPLAAVLLVVTPLARDRGGLATALLGLPPLAGLTAFALPDGPLLAAWAVAIAGAAAGGRGWLVAGAAAGVAFEAKYTGALVFPLLWLAADPAERRSRDVGLGAGLALAIAAPNLVWNAVNGLATARFVAGDGLGRGFDPAAWWTQPLGQALFVGPIFFGAAGVWAARGPGSDRIDRIAWWTSVPVLLGFAVVAPFGEAEAHWPAPAWIGLSIGLFRASGRVARAAGLGAALGAVATAAAAVHATVPLIRLEADPRWELDEGRALAAAALAWVTPAPDEVARPVVAERYQEAAWLAFYLGLPVLRIPGCGRDDQHHRWPETSPPAAPVWFVRPARGGEGTCAESDWVVIGRHRVVGIDVAGRTRASWDLLELRPQGAP